MAAQLQGLAMQPQGCSEIAEKREAARRAVVAMHAEIMAQADGFNTKR